ncbi:enoyl-CoA hydratase [Ferrimonas marina]|uniref:Enoyl-CoA hydratase/carnithine racemase n=1 Tax=Ferrimonas marina TaxID=299255 RepID=A0A1M5X7J2_9GAMM|nr:enoyl-CoA hydratase [Ferrimonas marina]SHH95193.1 Enoyl-CoA hydratase/carnithine racemase [Ferrimonas marina]
MDPVLCHRHGGVMVLTLNRQNKRNALTQNMYAVLVQHLEQAESDPEVRAVLFQGSAECFCAGNDLNDFLALDQVNEQTPVLRFVRQLPKMTKPLLAAVAGPAVGIGTTLLLHCDLVYATADARLQLPFVNLGIVPEAGSSLLLPLHVGRQRASELLLLGQPFSGQQAADWGMINAIVPAEELLELAMSRAQALAAQPPKAMISTLALLRQSRPADLEVCIERELELFLQHVNSAECRQILTQLTAR